MLRPLHKAYLFVLSCPHFRNLRFCVFVFLCFCSILYWAPLHVEAFWGTWWRCTNNRDSWSWSSSSLQLRSNYFSSQQVHICCEQKCADCRFFRSNRYVPYLLLGKAVRSRTRITETIILVRCQHLPQKGCTCRGAQYKKSTHKNTKPRNRYVRVGIA